MRYKVKGIEIKSENAARSAWQTSRELVEKLKDLPPRLSVVDYGCGKLRYSVLLAERARELVLIDSSAQVDRVQSIHGRKTTVRQFVEAELPSARVETIEEFSHSARRYDFVLCANVLSAIPSYKIRAETLNAIRQHLRRNGKALFATQYRNSYFERARKASRSEPYLDGWLSYTGNGVTFYGLITPKRLEEMVRRHGLSVVESWRKDGSAFVMAERCG